MAALCYMHALVFIPWFTAPGQTAFVRFHLEQGRNLLVCFFMAGVFAHVLGGWPGGLAEILTGVAYVAFAAFGACNALKGTVAPLPFLDGPAFAGK
jgi:hypothetical protein